MNLLQMPIIGCCCMADMFVQAVLLVVESARLIRFVLKILMGQSWYDKPVVTIN